MKWPWPAIPGSRDASPDAGESASGDEASEGVLAAAARGAALLVAGRIAARLGGLVFFVLMARLFASDLVGEFAAAQAVGLILYGLIDFGLGSLFVRDVTSGAGPGTSTIRPAIRLRVVVLAVSFVVILSLGVGSLLRTVQLGFVWLAFAFDATAALILAGARRDQKLGRIAIAEMVRSWGAPLVLVAVWMLSGRGVPHPWHALMPFASFALASAASALLVAAWGASFIRVELGKVAREGTRYWREGLVLAAATVAVGFHNRVDLLMLRVLDTAEGAARYAGAYLFVNGAYILPILVSYALFPELSRLPTDGGLLHAVVDRGARVLAIVGSMVGALLASCAPILLGVAYGPEYEAGSPALVVLAAAVPFVFVSNLHWNTLVSRGQQSKALVYIGFAAVLNALLNAALIPTFSLVGAAVATLIAEAFVWLASRRALEAVGLAVSSPRRAAATCLAALGPVLLCAFLPTGVPIWIRVPLAIGCWYGCVRAGGLVGSGGLLRALGVRRTTR